MIYYIYIHANLNSIKLSFSFLSIASAFQSSAYLKCTQIILITNICIRNSLNCSALTTILSINWSPLKLFLACSWAIKKTFELP